MPESTTKGGGARAPDSLTPPAVDFTAAAVSKRDKPDQQHGTELQITKGNKVALSWNIRGPFTSAELEWQPARRAPRKIPAKGTESVVVEEDCSFRLVVLNDGARAERVINVHSHDAGQAVSTIATVRPPADAQEVEEDALLNCDLCFLAYQLYHQSLIWPLDPWYEVLARGGTSRRTHFMNYTHDYSKTLPDRTSELYAGPAVVGRLGASNATLDPVLTNYGHLRPRDPAITGDGECYIALRAPAYVVEPIRKTSVAYYVSGWQPQWPHGATVIREVHDQGSGDDELIAFEGGTGTLDAKEAAYSLMGYALKRTRKDGGWDAHIAFRGSRSGDAVRAAAQGLMGEGNSDWVSDTSSLLLDDPYYNGQVAKGFAAAFKRCMGPLRAALLQLHQKYGAPRSVQVTGHSLGAALASLCSTALMQGLPGKKLSVELPGWDFAHLRGYFNALPPSGSEGTARRFLELTGGRAYAPYIAGDVVVENSRSVALKDKTKAAFIFQNLGSGGASLGKLDRMPRPEGSVDNDNPHEMTLIRAGLVAKRLAAGKSVPDEVKKATPMAYYLNFTDLLDGKAISYVHGDKPTIVTRDNLRTVLGNYRFATHFRVFLNLLKDAVSDPKSYRGLHRESSYQQAAGRFALAAEMAATPIDSKDPKVIVDNVGTQAAALLGFTVKKDLVPKGWKAVRDAARDALGAGLEADELLGEHFCSRIGLGLVLTAFEEHPETTLDKFAEVPELKLCLEASLQGATKADKQIAAKGGRG